MLQTRTNITPKEKKNSNPRNTQTEFKRQQNRIYIDSQNIDIFISKFSLI